MARDSEGEDSSADDSDDDDYNFDDDDDDCLTLNSDTMHRLCNYDPKLVSLKI